MSNRRGARVDANDAAPEPEPDEWKRRFEEADRGRRELAAVLDGIRTGAVDAIRTVEGHPGFLRLQDAELVAENEQLMEELSCSNQKLRLQATTDELTNIPNRRHLITHITRELERAKRYDMPLSILLLDLDYFKRVNDRFGHLTGDAVLKSFGQFLLECARETDLVGRYGGEEFCVVVANTSLDDAALLAQRLCKRASAMSHKAIDSGGEFQVTCSIGVAGHDNGVSDAAEFLSRADAALYQAKDWGRDRVQIYLQSDAELTKRQAELQWATRINQALEDGRFCLYAQSIVPVSSATREGEHHEVLLRMKTEDGRLVLPGAFLPAAERFHLATKLDRWVTSTMFEWLANHPERLVGLHTCALNLSGHSLADEGFLAFVVEQLRAWEVPAERICFEVTETAAIQNLSKATHLIETLKTLGCRFSLDDFGSGLSSFTYLKNLPVDYLKIDGSFVKGIASSGTDFAMVKAINEVGRVLGKQTIAEYVENEAILEKLQSIGVDYAQGFGISRPQPIEEMANVQAADNERTPTPSDSFTKIGGQTAGRSCDLASRAELA